MLDSECERDFEKSCLWMNENFGEDEGRRKRQNDPTWRRCMNTELLKAVSRGDSERVNRWLNYGASVNATYNHSGNTAVHIAASLDDDSILNKLLAMGASPRTKNKKGHEPIHVAVWQGNYGAVTALCRSDPTVVDSSIVLLGGGAEPNSDSDVCDGNESFEDTIPTDLENGITSLHIASMRNHLRIVELLIGNGANVGAFSTETNSTPLDVVGFQAEAPHDTEEAFMGVYNIFLKNKLQMPQIEKRFGNTRCWRDRKITTALHTAVKFNYLVAIEELLDKGASLGAWDEVRQTAIHLTIDLRRIEPLLTILKWNKEHQSLEVDARNGSGLTPLQYAVYLGRVNYVMVLLQGGADASLTALAKSESFDSYSNGFQFVYPERCKCYHCSPDAVAYKGLKKKDRLLLTLCCCAVLGKSLECLQMLSADVGALKFKLKNDMNLLHLAAWCNAPKIMRFLIDKFKEHDDLLDHMVNQICKEDIKGLNKFAMAPIHIASSHEEESTEIINCLVKEGKCDVTLQALLMVKDKKRWMMYFLPWVKDEKTRKLDRSHSALHFAARAANKENADLLYRYSKKPLNPRGEKQKQDRKLIVPDLAELCNCDTLRELLLRGADLSSTFKDDYQEHRLITLTKMYVDDHVVFLESILDEHINVELYNDRAGSNKPCVLNYRILAPGEEGEPQMKVLDALVTSEEIKSKRSLLLHPLTETFIHLKWQKLKTFYNIYVFFQLAMTILITALGCMEHVSEIQQYATETSSIILKNALAFVTTLIMVLNPTTGTKRLCKYVFIPNFRTLYRIAMFVLSAMMVLGNEGHQSERGVASLAILLSWIEVVYLLSRYPWSERLPLGYHFVMFIAVVSNFAQVAASFLLLFVAFALSFLVLLSDYDFDGDLPNPYKSPMRSFLKTITMITDFDNNQLFRNDTYLRPPENDHFLHVGSLLGSMVYLGFFFIMCIAMMNFMTGVAIDDLAELKDQGKARQIFEKIQTIKRLEILCKTFGINDVQVPLRKIVWPQDYVHMNDLPDKMCDSVTDRVKIILKKKKEIEGNEEREK